MADKSSQLILAALSQAAAASAPVPLHGRKAQPGLFPTTVPGKQAARRCLDEGYLRHLADDVSAEAAPASVLTASPGVNAASLCILTDKGWNFLLNESSPRQVLEDFVRILEARQSQADMVLAGVRQMQVELANLRGSAERLFHHLQRTEPASSNGAATANGHLKALFQGFHQETPASDATLLTTELCVEMERWHVAGATEDCPLPHLYRQLQRTRGTMSIGAFHDALRRLHDDGKIYLHPWTGPLYDIPEPPYALLVGHEIAYYASTRS